MRNFKFKNSCLAIAALCFLLGLAGCGGDEDTAPAQPEVVATKIKTGAPKKAAPAKKPAAPKADQKPAAAEKASGAPEGDEVSIQETMEEIKQKAAAGVVSRYQARLYNPEGKINPFSNPLKKDTPEQAVETDDGEDPNAPDRIRQTPLERIDLSQLTLVGVIRFPAGHTAIVEEESGKGYMIKVGTYIGTNYGQVTEIQTDRIIIQEKVKDILGKYKDHTSQLKIQKPLGEN